MDRHWFRLTAVVVLAAFAGCAGPRSTPAAATLADDDAAATFAALESRLLATRSTAIDYRVTATGAFQAEIEGTLVLREDGDLALTGVGTFGGGAVDLSVRVTDGRMVGGNADHRFDEPVPPALREALVLGLTRMGVLHNLARLTAGRAPDHAGGGVGEWVRARAVEWSPPAEAAAGRALRFDIVVSGERTADAVLRLAPDGWPAERSQTVRFPGGEMRVVETYSTRPEEP